MTVAVTWDFRVRSASMKTPRSDTGCTDMLPVRTGPVAIWCWRRADEHQSTSVLMGLSCSRLAIIQDDTSSIIIIIIIINEFHRDASLTKTSGPLISYCCQCRQTTSSSAQQHLRVTESVDLCALLRVVLARHDHWSRRRAPDTRRAAAFWTAKNNLIYPPAAPVSIAWQ